MKEPLARWWSAWTMPGEHAGAAQQALGVTILGRASLRLLRVALFGE